MKQLTGYIISIYLGLSYTLITYFTGNLNFNTWTIEQKGFWGAGLFILISVPFIAQLIINSEND